MFKIKYIEDSGRVHDVEAEEGTSLMAAAVANMVVGIDGDCGGDCACGTCHVHVAPEWAGRLSPASDEEKGMLEFADEPDEYSRLSCQIKLTPELDGIVVRVPPPQR